MARGDLYAATPVGQDRVFPEWPFGPDSVILGLREGLPLLPGDYRPLDVERFMTSPNEGLYDRSPRDWSIGGGDFVRGQTVVEQLRLA